MASFFNSDIFDFSCNFIKDGEFPRLRLYEETIETTEDGNQFQLYSDSENCEVLSPSLQSFGFGDLEIQGSEQTKVGKTQLTAKTRAGSFECSLEEISLSKAISKKNTICGSSSRSSNGRVVDFGKSVKSGKKSLHTKAKIVKNSSNQQFTHFKKEFANAKPLSTHLKTKALRFCSFGPEAEELTRPSTFPLRYSVEFQEPQLDCEELGDSDLIH